MAYISTNTYLVEFVKLTKSLENDTLTKEQKLDIVKRRNYIRQYLSDHRDVKLRSRFSYIQLDLLNLARSTTTPELLDAILNKIRANIKEVEEALKEAPARALEEEKLIAAENLKNMEVNSQKTANKIAREIKAKARAEANEIIFKAKIKLEEELAKAKEIVNAKAI